MARQDSGGLAIYALLSRLKRSCRSGSRTTRFYEQINPLPPAGIGKKSAHVIGGGIGGLSVATFLVDDAQHAREQDHGV